MEQKTIDIIKIVLMLGLIITMLSVGIVILKYGVYIKSNPCDLCDCTIQILKGGYDIYGNV